MLDGLAFLISETNDRNVLKFAEKCGASCSGKWIPSRDSYLLFLHLTPKKDVAQHACPRLTVSVLATKGLHYTEELNTDCTHGSESLTCCAFFCLFTARFECFL